MYIYRNVVIISKLYDLIKMQVKIKSTQYIEIFFEILGKKMYREEKKTLQKFLLNLKEYIKLHK